MKFRKLLSITFLIFTIVPLLFVTVLSFMRLDQNTKTTISNALTSLAQTQISSIQNFCETHSEALDLISEYQYVKNVISASLNGEEPSPGEFQLVKNLVTERKKTLDFVQNITLIDSNFEYIYSTEPIEAEDHNRFKNFITKTYDQELNISRSYMLENDKGEFRVFMNYVPVYLNGKGSSLIGYFLEEVSSDVFLFLSQSLHLPPDSFILVVDDDFNMLSFYTNQSGEYNEISDDLQNAFIAEMQKIDTKKYPESTYTFSYNKEKFVGFSSIIPNSNWLICMNVRYDSYFSPTRSFKVMIVEFVVCIIFLEICLILFLSKVFTKPINSMTKKIHNIRIQQDFSYRMNLTKKDEIGLLGSEIDGLLDHIEQRYQKAQTEQSALKEKATQDPLTKVQNQDSIMNTIEKIIQSANTDNRKIALGFIDIDNFRNFNSEYGHQGGDEVIVNIASNLEKFFGKNVGRNGGDEFLFILNVDSVDSILQPIANFMKSLQEGFVISGTKKVVVSCSLGIVIAAPNKCTRKELIKLADNAMYKVKNQGKNNYIIVEI